MIRPLRAIVLEARIDATPADVWHALTDSRALADWFAPYIKAGQGVGAIVEMAWDPAATWPTTIEIWEPERHLRLADEAPPSTGPVPPPRLAVDWLISTEAGQTVLRLVHSGFGEGAKWDEQVEGSTGGWTYFLWNLEVCLTRHRGVHRRLVSARKRVAGSRSAFWHSLFSSGLMSVESNVDETERCTLTLGSQSFTGIVGESVALQRLSARLPSLADAMLFIELEGAAPTGFHAGVWLSTYGVDEATVADLQRALDDAVETLAAATAVDSGVAAL